MAPRAVFARLYVRVLKRPIFENGRRRPPGKRGYRRHAQMRLNLCSSCRGALLLSNGDRAGERFFTLDRKEFPALFPWLIEVNRHAGGLPAGRR